ncbi:MAG: FTR1 family protein, partial [Bacillota bacterium]|nr:FTR1 family protein [Bacillota bacterium]
ARCGSSKWRHPASAPRTSRACVKGEPVYMMDFFMAAAPPATVYSAFDAAAIVLREGFEALLLLVALLALVDRAAGSAAQRRRQRWAIGGGAAGGLLLAFLLGWTLQRWLALEAAEVGRELVEGLAGVAAVLLMLSVGRWIHEKATVQGWNRFLREQAGPATARGSLLPLALIAGTAVLREGVEAVVFFAGMATAIAPGALATGLGGALLALAVAGVLAVRLGWRLPVRAVFLVASLLLDVMAFKFAGQGVHALQEAGLIPESLAPAPAWDFLGLYPTWQSLLAQLLVLVAVAALWLQAGRRREQSAVRPG